MRRVLPLREARLAPLQRHRYGQQMAKWPTGTKERRTVRGALAPRGFPSPGPPGRLYPAWSGAVLPETEGSAGQAVLNPWSAYLPGAMVPSARFFARR